MTQKATSSLVGVASRDVVTRSPIQPINGNLMTGHPQKRNGRHRFYTLTSFAFSGRVVEVFQTKSRCAHIFVCVCVCVCTKPIARFFIFYRIELNFYPGKPWKKEEREKEETCYLYGFSSCVSNKMRFISRASEQNFELEFICT